MEELFQPHIEMATVTTTSTKVTVISIKNEGPLSYGPFLIWYD
jgi:hypothetical protein